MSGWSFFLEVLFGGLLSGIMYSFVALGFVLIYKASGVFNFSQGAMVLFAALTFVSVNERGVPRPAAFAVTAVVMILLAVVIERLVLRPLLNQPPIVLFLATMGLAFLIEGVAQLVWGTQVHGLDLGIPDEPVQVGPVALSQFDLAGAAVAATLVGVLALLFRWTRTGRALRAVADDPQAAQSVGISLRRMWAVVWAGAGLVSLVAGLVWGARLGVQFSLTQVTLKALPVLILGGFNSIAGVIVGGLVIGASEKLADVYLGAHIGGGIENWAPYMLAIAVLLLRPTGLFGAKALARV